jgi:hypothetical protein
VEDCGPCIEVLRNSLADFNGVVESPSMFKNDLGYWVHGNEIAHFEGDGIPSDERASLANTSVGQIIHSGLREQQG